MLGKETEKKKKKEKQTTTITTTSKLPTYTKAKNVLDF